MSMNPPSDERFNVWITKYALTSGIQCKSVTQSTIHPDMVTAGSLEHYHGEGRDWHRSWDSALARAEAMRVAKIASLRRSIGKLEKLEFRP